MPALREIFAEYDVVFDRQRNLQRGNRMVSRLSASLRRIRGPVVSATQALGAMAAGAGVAAAAGLQQIVSSTIESTREIDRWASRMSISSEALRSWTELGREYGASVDDITDALSELQLKAQDALSGGTEQAEMFERIGISLEDLRPVVNDMESLTNLYTDALNDNVDASMQMFVTDELMSDAGRRALPIFRLGTQEIQRRRAALTQAAGPTAELSRIVAEHGRRVRAITRRWERFKRELTARVLPIIGQLAEKVSEFEEPARNMIRWISRIAQETEILQGILVGVGVVAVGVAAATIGAWGPMVAAFIGIAAAVAGIAVAWDQVSRTIGGANTKLREYLDSEEILGQGGTEGLLLLLSDRWENMKRNISNATDALVEFGETIQPILSALQSVWEMITFISSGFGLADVIRDQILPDGILGGIRGAAQARVREERSREGARRDAESFARGMDPQNVAVEELERAVRWEGPGTDISGQPLSVPELARTREIPTVPRSAAIETARLPRQERAQAQSISIESQPVFNFDISEATDADEVTRLVTQEVTQAQSRWVSELESLISDQTEVGS
jgi:hypothetical protein